jgi:adenine-specific DNA-methyltransferase
MLIKDKTRVIRLEDSKSIEILKKMREKRNFKIPSDHIMQGLVIPQSKVKRSHLKNLKNPDIEIGDGIFVLSDVEKSGLKLCGEEKNLVKPFHLAQDIDCFYYDPKENEWILYITKPYIEYDKNDVNKMISQKNFSRKETLKKILDEMERKYPNIINHLNPFQKIITSDKKPYGLHRPRMEEAFESKAKIISVRKTPYPKFAFVPIDYYIDQSVYYIIIDREDILLYLLGLFNSKLAWFFFKKTKTHGNQLQVDKSVLKRFPIVISLEKKRDIDNLVEKLIDLLKDGNYTTNSKSVRDLKLKLDTLFFQIYEIELEQILFILNFLEIGDLERKRIIEYYNNEIR